MFTPFSLQFLNVQNLSHNMTVRDLRLRDISIDFLKRRSTGPRTLVIKSKNSDLEPLEKLNTVFSHEIKANG